MIKKFILLSALFSVCFTSVYSQKIWTLNDCINYATENNIDIKSSKLNVKRAELSSLQSKLDYAPSVNGNSNYSFNTGRVLDPTTYTFVENKSVNNISMGLSASATLFAGLQKYSNLKKTEKELEATQSELLQLQNNIQLNVSLYYLQILLNQEIVASIQTQIEASNQNIERMDKLVLAGSATKGDLLNLVAQRSNEQYSLADAQTKVNSAKIELCQIMNLQDYAEFEVETPVFKVDEGVFAYKVDSVFEVALALPEIASKIQRQEASRFSLKSARSAYYPTIRASYSYNTSYSDSRSKVLLDGSGKPVIDANGAITYTKYPFGEQLRDNQSHGLGVGLSVPIFNSLTVRNNVKVAKLASIQAEYDINSAKNKLYKDVNQALNDVKGARMQYVAAKDKLEANNENMRFTEERFKQGASTLTDFVIAKNNAMMAEAQLAQAKYTYIFKLEVIDYYLCRGIGF